ncbi:MAG: 4Fe-4S binding protein [candidate division Zixibacteria bacterium]|nr:4Fe-4S binding protein [candidate division Zixibacteria bacterium]
MTVRKLRIVTQVLFFLFFLYLFWITSEISGRLIPVDLFLRADPLLAVTGIIAARAIIPAMFISVVVIIATLLLGRVFCGWVCPMGTTLDLTSRIGNTANRYKLNKTHHLKYYLLIGFLVASILGFQLVYHLDPISLITRTFTVVILPILVKSFNFIFNLLFNIKPLQIPLLQIQSSMVDSLLPLEPYFFQSAFVLGLIFTIIIGFELYSRRTFCQSVCPLGALLGLLCKPQILTRKVDEDGCTMCAQCQDVCKTNAIPDDYHETELRECIQCFNCVDTCPENVITINFTGAAQQHKTDFTRRKLVFAGAGGIAGAAFTGISFIRPDESSKLIRPPGTVSEKEFVERCVRCYQCIRACATSGNFLQPSLLEGGWESLLSPYGVAATGYCEFNCTLCTEVCPTDAIKELDMETKHKTIIGLAFFDKNRCLPYKDGTPCIVCEEHCPTPEKAIQFNEEEYTYPDGSSRVIKVPYVVENLCIGCGICEYKCPVEGAPGIYVTNQTERSYNTGLYGYP